MTEIQKIFLKSGRVFECGYAFDKISGMVDDAGLDEAGIPLCPSWMWKLFKNEKLIVSIPDASIDFFAFVRDVK